MIKEINMKLTNLRIKSKFVMSHVNQNLILNNPLWWNKYLTLEFDPGSGRTLAACLKHASRTNEARCLHRAELVADG